MLNLLKSIFNHNILLNKTTFKNELNNSRIRTNFRRCRKFGVLLIILYLILVTINLILFNPMKSKGFFYFYLLYSQALCAIFCVFWFIFLKLQKNLTNKIDNSFLCYSFIFINLFGNVFMGLINLYITGQTSVYIICILSISICLYLTPLEAFFTYFIPHIVFILGLTTIISDKNSLYSNIISSSIALLLSFVISQINFAYFAKEFAHKKILIESKKELEITNEKLKEYDKLRTDFFANISHELKTPINIISCAEQMMETLPKQNFSNDFTVNKYLKMIKQNSFRLIRLVGNLIDITKIDSFNFQVDFVNLDIIKFIEDITMSIVAYVENKGLSITFDTVIEEKIIGCDPNQIERVILNLLSNSIKFTPKGGSILVSIYMRNNITCISVKDTGIGIPDTMKDLIFDRFVQVDKSTSKKNEGCGIGLSLVKSLVEMHGGNVKVNTKLGQGSEFIVMLPNNIVTSDKNIHESSLINQDSINKINIEFSDIYD